MKKSLLFISAASLLLAGCAKEQLVKEQRNDGAVTVVKATFEQLSNSATRTAVTDAGVFTWQNGDKAAFAESDASVSYCSGENSADGATATFAIDGSHTFTSASWAVYPYDLTSGQTPAALKVSVPASRVWAAGQTNVAMYGVKDASAASFNFSHMGGLVRVRVNNVPTNAREFVFKAGGCKINGDFAVNTVSEYKVIETAASDNESEQTYTLTWADAPAAENTMDFFIPLPVGTYGGGFAFYLKDADHNNLYSKVGSTSQTIARKKLLLMPAITLMGGAIEPAVDDDDKVVALPGVFSVSATKKVQFSPGNLYVKKDDSGNWNWNFYDEQYACNSLNSLCGDWGVRTPTSGDNEIDLFSWGYGDWSTDPITTSYLKKHTSEGEPFEQTEDWGSAIDDKGTWRTLTEAEWCYLFAYLYDYESYEGDFDTESPRYNLFKIEVTVCGHTNCVVLLPDDWEWGGTVGDTWQTEYNEETTVKWSSMEAAGAVCLPAAGYRRIASSAAEIREVGGCGLYWTSSTCYLPDWGFTGGYSYYLYITRRTSSYIPASLILGPDAAEFRNYGCSVRLVTDVPAK